jgi:hypothetical protein
MHQLIRLNPITAGAPCREDLRLVTVWDERNQCEVKLLTNQLEFAANTIADIYRERWQIELFFKALKQNLKIKTFVGTSANAVRIQIWTALIAILLLKILQFKSIRQSNPPSGLGVFLMHCRHDGNRRGWRSEAAKPPRDQTTGEGIRNQWTAAERILSQA